MMIRPPLDASASEWLAAGWEWRDSAWWKWLESNKTWYRVANAEARPMVDAIKPPQEAQG